MESNNRMGEITGNLKRDMKDLLSESANLVTGFFKRGLSHRAFPVRRTS